MSASTMSAIPGGDGPGVRIGTSPRTRRHSLQDESAPVGGKAGDPDSGPRVRVRQVPDYASETMQTLIVGWDATSVPVSAHEGGP